MLSVGKKGLFVGECAGIGLPRPRRKGDVVGLEEECGSLVVSLPSGRYAVLVDTVDAGEASGGFAFIVPASDSAAKTAKPAAVVTDAALA